MPEEPKTGGAPISNAGLRQIFNDFAQKSVTDFPSLQDRLLVYHHPTGEFFGPAATDGQVFTLDDKRSFLKQVESKSSAYFKNKNAQLYDSTAIKMAFAADSWLRRAPNGTYKPDLEFKMIVIGTLNPDKRLLSDANSPFEDEVRNVMEHELGHQVVPGGRSNGKNGAQFAESTADSFSLIRYAQRGGNLESSADTAAWTRNAKFMLRNQTDHLTTLAIEGVKDIAQRQDLKLLTAVETSNLAYRIARQYTPQPAEMEKLREIFKPVSAAFETGGMQAAMKATAEIMQQDHGPLNDRVFNLGRNFLEPALSGKRGDLTVMINNAPQSLSGIKLDGAYWDGIKRTISQRSDAASKTGSAALLEQEARDMKLMGKFDPDPSRPIPLEKLSEYDAAVNNSEASFVTGRRAKMVAPGSTFLKTPLPGETLANKAMPAEEILTASKTIHTRTPTAFKGGGIAAGAALATVSGLASAAEDGATTPGKVADAAINSAIPGWTAAKKGDLCAAFGEVAGTVASGAAIVATAPLAVTGALAVTAASGPGAPIVGPLAAAGATATVVAAGATTYTAVAPEVERICKAVVSATKPAGPKI